MSGIARELRPEALTAAAFGGFGDVVETGGTSGLINQGTTRQFADLANIDVLAEGGRPRISLYLARPYAFPLAIRMLERHPLGSQLFMPLSGDPFLIVVAAAGEDPDAGALRAFVSNGRQGINYHRGTWHHPLIAIHDPSEFLVIDRAGPGSNCDEVSFEAAIALRPPG